MYSKMEGNTLTLFFQQEPTANSLNELLQKTYEILDQHEAYEEVVVDLSDVRFIDSTGITFLIGLYRSLSRVEKRLRVTGARKEIRDLFEVVNLTNLFQVESN